MHVQAYARSAPRPRGTTLAQDFFDLGEPCSLTDPIPFTHAYVLPGAVLPFRSCCCCFRLKARHPLLPAHKPLPAHQLPYPYPCRDMPCTNPLPPGLIPADTDYRMFSYRNYGSLPGERHSAR